MIEKNWFNLKEAVYYTGLGVDYFRKQMYLGNIPYYKPGKMVLFAKEDLDKKIQGSKMDVVKA